MRIKSRQHYVHQFSINYRLQSLDVLIITNPPRFDSQLSSTAKVAAWFQQLNANAGASLSRPESGFVSGDSRSERNPEDPAHRFNRTGGGAARGTAGAITMGGASGSGIYRDRDAALKEQTMSGEDLCDEYLLVEGTTNLWGKLSAKKRRKLLSLRLGKVTTF